MKANGVILATVLASCGAKSPPAAGPEVAGSEAKGFPTAEELARITAEPVPADALATDEVDVDEWTLAGPLADALGGAPAVAATVWSGALDEKVGAKPGVAIATPEMACAAREVGRFFMAHKGRPGDALRRFIAARCGAPVVGIGVAFLSGEVPEDVSEAAIFEKWKAQVDPMTTDAVGAGSRAVGIWFGREGNRAVVAVASADRKVHVESTSLVADKEGVVR